MGCSNSKEKKARETEEAAKSKASPKPWEPSPREKGNKNDIQVDRTNGDGWDSTTRVAPQARPTAGAGAGAGAPAGSQSVRKEVNDDGDLVVLPRGDWVRTEGTPFYYSEKENLYFHPPSCQFYDPTNEMWYDPEKDEWYRDEDEQQ